MSTKSDPLSRLRKLALAHPGSDDGIACAGTAMERHTVTAANGKAFVFFGVADALLKLDASLDKARQLASREPERYRVGANGWVKLVYSEADPPDFDTIAPWIAESHALVAATRAAKKPKRPAQAKTKANTKRSTRRAR